MSVKRYSMYRRKPSGIYYYQRWNPDTRKYETAKSTGIRHKTKAIQYVQAQIAKEAIQQPANSILVTYVLEMWNFATSKYIQRKLARRPHSIGKAYCQTNYHYALKYAKPFFKQQLLASITPRDLQAFIDHLKATTSLSARSINGIYDAVAVPIREAYRMQEIPNDPTRPIRKLWVPPVEKGIPSASEMLKLFQTEWESEPARLAAQISAMCALRLGEILALQLEDLKTNTIHVRHSWSRLEGLKPPKNGRSRIVTVPDQLMAQIRQYCQHHGRTTWLFPGISGNKPISDGALSHGFNRALTAIGITEAERRTRKLSFHSLRHFCNAMLRGSVSDAKLRLLTGHRSNELTERYDHITESDTQSLRSAQERHIMPFIQPAKKSERIKIC